MNPLTNGQVREKSSTQGTMKAVGIVHYMEGACVKKMKLQCDARKFSVYQEVCVYKHTTSEARYGWNAVVSYSLESQKADVEYSWHVE